MEEVQHSGADSDEELLTAAREAPRSHPGGLEGLLPVVQQAIGSYIAQADRQSHAEVNVNTRDTYVVEDPRIAQAATGSYIAQAAEGATAIGCHLPCGATASVDAATVAEATRLRQSPADTPPAAALPPHSRVPLAHNDLFTGRIQELRWLASPSVRRWSRSRPSWSLGSVVLGKASSPVNTPTATVASTLVESFG